MRELRTDIGQVPPVRQWYAHQFAAVEAGAILIWRWREDLRGRNPSMACPTWLGTCVHAGPFEPRRALKHSPQFHDNRLIPRKLTLQAGSRVPAQNCCCGGQSRSFRSNARLAITYCKVTELGRACLDSPASRGVRAHVATSTTSHPGIEQEAEVAPSWAAGKGGWVEVEARLERLREKRSRVATGRLTAARNRQLQVSYGRQRTPTGTDNVAAKGCWLAESSSELRSVGG